MSLEALPPIVGSGIAARMYRSVQTTLATSNGWNKVPLDTTAFDTAGGFQPANNRWVAPVSGYYHIDADAGTLTAAAGVGMAIGIYVNGSEVSQGNNWITATAASQGYNLEISDLLHLNAGDYVELFLYTSPANTMQGGYFGLILRLSIFLVSGGAQGPQGPQGPTGGPLPSLDLTTSTTFTAASGPTTPITWDRVTTRGPTPNQPLWVAGTPTRLYADRDGWWQLSLSYAWPGTGGGTYRQCFITNGAGTQVGADMVPPPPAVGWNRALTRTFWMTAGDYITVNFNHDQGGTLTMGVPFASWTPVQGVRGDPGAGVPTPVVNGQWIKGSGGAAVWSPITAADVTGLATLNWQTLSMYGNYTHYATPYGPVQYARDAMGWMHVRGLAIWNQGATFDGQIISGPAAYLASPGLTIIQRCGYGATGLGTFRLDVDASGNMIPREISGTAPSGGNWSGTWLSLFLNYYVG